MIQIETNDLSILQCVLNVALWHIDHRYNYRHWNYKMTILRVQEWRGTGKKSFTVYSAEARITGPRLLFIPLGAAIIPDQNMSEPDSVE